MTESLSVLTGQNITALSGTDKLTFKIVPEGNKYKLTLEIQIDDGFIENPKFKDRTKPEDWTQGELELGLNKNLVSGDEPVLFLSSNTAKNIFLNLRLSLSTVEKAVFKPWQIGGTSDPSEKRKYQTS